jgi:hypothetical protein
LHPRHPKRRAAALAIALLRRSVGSYGAPAIASLAAASVVLAPAPAPAWAQVEAYKLHMENGVKLYNDRNYPAAVAEFRAAYEARPNPNPLVNVALCEKALFHYPKAIAALETALARHGEAMDAGDKKAAEDAIREMRALLGTVVVTTKPAGATLIVDGEELPAGAGDKPLLLGPGAHKIEARAEGFATKEKRFTVASGQTQEVSVELAAEKGTLIIEASDPRMSISVDQHPMGTGKWTGLLPPGTHLVQVQGPGGEPYEAQVLVVAGKDVTVRPGAGPAKPPATPVRRGLYVLATGSILFPLVNAYYFQDPQRDFGAAFGARVGYQVNNVAGFDLSFQHSSIQTYKRNDLTGEASFRLISERVGAGLRLTTPGTMFRFVATFGGGLVYDQVQWGPKVADACLPESELPKNTVCPLDTKANVHGFDAFGVVEAVAELDIDRVLVDLGLEGQFQSTGNISSGHTNTNYAGSMWGTLPIINIGPTLRVGYRFW